MTEDLERLARAAMQARIDTIGGRKEVTSTDRAITVALLRELRNLSDAMVEAHISTIPLAFVTCLGDPDPDNAQRTIYRDNLKRSLEAVINAVLGEERE